MLSLRSLGLSSFKSKVIFLLLCFILIIAPFYPELNKISVWFLLPILFSYFFFRNNHTPKYFIPFIVLFIFSSLSFIYCINIDAYLLASRKLAATIMFSFIIIRVSFLNLKITYSIYAIYLLILIYSLYFTYSKGILLVDTGSRERFDIEVFGTNVLGYYLFFSVFSLWIFSISFSKNKFWILVFYALLIPTGLIFIALGGSRGGLIFVTLATVLYVFFELASKKSLPVKIIYLIIIGLVAAIIIASLFDMLEGMYVYERLNSAIHEGENDHRWELIKKSLYVGFNYFFTGVGTGNVSLFLDGYISHSSYTEIFANHGIFGFILFFYMIYDFYKNAIKLTKTPDLTVKKYGYCFLTFIFLFFLYNFLYVMYMNFIVMGFFFLMRSHIYIIQKKYVLQKFNEITYLYNTKKYVLQKYNV